MKARNPIFRFHVLSTWPFEMQASAMILYLVFSKWVIFIWKVIFPFLSFLVIECYECYEACIGPLWGRVRRVTTRGCFTVVKNMVSKHKVYDVSYPCLVESCYSVWVTTHLWERGYRTLGSFTFFVTLLSCHRALLPKISFLFLVRRTSRYDYLNG